MDGYQGYFPSDGYDVYEDFANQKGITLVGCLVHARRKLDEGLPEDKTRAEEVLTMFSVLYVVELNIKNHQIVGEAKVLYRKENFLHLF